MNVKRSLMAQTALRVRPPQGKMSSRRQRVTSRRGVGPPGARGMRYRRCCRSAGGTDAVGDGTEEHATGMVPVAASVFCVARVRVRANPSVPLGKRVRVACKRAGRRRRMGEGRRRAVAWHSVAPGGAVCMPRQHYVPRASVLRTQVVCPCCPYAHDRWS